MDLRSFLAAFSTILLIGSLVPYLVGVIRRSVKPRVVTWFVWATINSIACIATIIDGQYITALFISCFALSSLAVVLFGWKNGDKKIGRFDMVCLIGAIVGIVLWQVFNSPAIAVLAMITIDFIGSVPTIRHSWQKPNEEQWVTFMLSFLGSVIALVNIYDWKITAFAYPVYMIFNNLTLALVVLSRRRFLAKK